MPKVTEFEPRTHPNREHPFSLDEIDSFAQLTEAQLKHEIAIAKPLIVQNWQNFKAKLQPNDTGWWIGDKNSFNTFWQTLSSIEETVGHDNTDELSRMILTRQTLNPEWREISAFMEHDMHWLNPIAVFSVFHYVDTRRIRTKTTEIHSRQIDFFDELCTDSFRLFDQVVYPISFVRNVINIERHKKIHVQSFNPLQLYEDIAKWIKGRDYQDDYDIFINSEPTTIQTANCIIIQCPEDLQIQCSQEMLFGIIMNLVKNASKANLVVHDDQNDLAASKLYLKDGQLENPKSIALIVEEQKNNINFSIRDEGSGMSLDSAISRMHEALLDQLSDKTPEQIRDSDWYWNMRKQVGKRQAEFMMSWPTNSDALRKVEIGTVLDCQFIAGFSGQYWSIPSITTGLGLWGVRYITERLKGTVFGTNSFEGGAQFTVSIPKRSLGLT